MKLTVVAATGGIGRQVLAQAVAAGHDVTAVIRNPQNLPPTQVQVIVADLATADSHVLQPAVEGADAVLSGLGARTCGVACSSRAPTSPTTCSARSTSPRRSGGRSALPTSCHPWVAGSDGIRFSG